MRKMGAQATSQEVDPACVQFVCSVIELEAGGSIETFALLRGGNVISRWVVMGAWSCGNFWARLRELGGLACGASNQRLAHPNLRARLQTLGQRLSSELSPFALGILSRHASSSGTGRPLTLQNGLYTRGSSVVTETDTLQARNSEKAQSMLFRFREAQAADLGIIDAGRTRRPKRITEVDSIPSCEKWRGQVLREISRKVSRIQEPVLSDYQIRDLNDEINKLMREKHMWEVQIRNLGGPNYMRGGGRIYDEQGREIPGGGKGYRYFGRAKELPGVKELFEAAQSRGKEDKPLEESKDLRRNVDAAYYGYAPGEETDELLRYEAGKEREAAANLIKNGLGEPPDGWTSLPGDTDGETWLLPTMEEVQEELLERRRQKLLRQL